MKQHNNIQHNVNAEEWMDRLRIAAIDFNYKEIDRKLKEQFIHGLNDNGMMVEIIKGPTKTEENTLYVLVCRHFYFGQNSFLFITGFTQINDQRICPRTNKYML